MILPNNKAIAVFPCHSLQGLSIWESNRCPGVDILLSTSSGDKNMLNAECQYVWWMTHELTPNIGLPGSRGVVRALEPLLPDAKCADNR